MSTALVLMEKQEYNLLVIYVRPTRYSAEETGITYFINSRGV